MKVRNVIADGLIMALSAALLWHFSNIWRYGQYLAVESNVIIRSLEMAGLLGIFIFGATKYISYLSGSNRLLFKEATNHDPY